MLRLSGGEVSLDQLARLLTEASIARYKVRDFDRDAVVEFLETEADDICRDLGHDPRLLQAGLSWNELVKHGEPLVQLRELDAVTALGRVT